MEQIINRVNNNPKISVITVSYNCVDTIEETILSVINQTYTNVEYIIIDGGSNDGTIEVVRKHQDKIDNWVSEPDGGIYDAMNKAINLAKGDYIIFMNAGDIFYNESVIEKVFSSDKIINQEIIYGSVVLNKKEGEIELKPGNLDEFWKGSRFCHQSVFISLPLHKKFPYNLKYKIAADYNFFNIMYINKKRFLYLDFPFSKVAMGGISDIGRIKLIKENLEILNDKRLKVYYYYIVQGLKAIILSRGKILKYYLLNK